MDAELCALLARPMEGAIRLALTRAPSPRRASEVEGDRYRLVTARHPHSGALVGMGVRTVRDVFFAGRPARVGYLGQLRVVDRVGFGRWRDGFRRLLDAREPDELGFDLTTIAADNQVARRLLERGLRGLPAYRQVGEITTLVFSTAGARGLATRTATAADLDAIVDRLAADGARFVLAPRWSRQDLQPEGRCVGLSLDDFLLVEDAGRLRGGVAIWDQRAFKQVVVAGYAGWLALLRPVLNPWLRLAGQPRLPRPGTLALAYLSHFSADDAAAAIALVAAARARARQRGLEQLVLSLSSRHPRLAAIRRAVPARRYLTGLYAVGATAAEAETLRHGVAHLEGATL